MTGIAGCIWSLSKPAPGQPPYDATATTTLVKESHKINVSGSISSIKLTNFYYDAGTWSDR